MTDINIIKRTISRSMSEIKKHIHFNSMGAVVDYNPTTTLSDNINMNHNIKTTIDPRWDDQLDEIDTNRNVIKNTIEQASKLKSPSKSFKPFRPSLLNVEELQRRLSKGVATTTTITNDNQYNINNINVSNNALDNIIVNDDDNNYDNDDIDIHDIEVDKRVITKIKNKRKHMRIRRTKFGRTKTIRSRNRIQKNR